MQTSADLSTFTIVLILAGKFLVLEAIKHFADRFCWFGKHRLQRDPGSELALIAKAIKAIVQKCRDDDIVRGQFASRT